MKNFWVFLILLNLTRTFACEVPVFRFALERWPADPLHVEVTADATGGADGEAALKWLRNQMSGTVPANVATRLVDVAGAGGPNMMRLFPAQHAGDGPPPVLWHGAFNEANARDLTGSPMRERIAAKLLGGTSAVWLVVSNGNADADAAAMRTVQDGLDRAKADLRLPAGVIRPDQAARKFAENPTATMDDVLRTTIPLDIRFEVVLLRHDDGAEAIFRDILRALAPPSSNPGEPLVAPMFGRGRLLPPAPASALDVNAVFKGCAYLCGSCACMVKQQNPGIDIPFRTDWDAHLKPHLAVIDHAPPTQTPQVVTYGAVDAPQAAGSMSHGLSWLIVGGFILLVWIAWILARRMLG